MNKNKIIKEYVDLIVENSLKNIFIDPFLDVVKTAAYAIEDLSVRVKSLLKNIIQGLPTLFIPFLTADYSSVRKEEKEQLNQIQKKYSEVLKGTDQALVSNDAFGLNFLLFPQSAIAGKLLRTAPNVALSLLDILTGGSIPFIQKLNQQLSQTKAEPVHFNSQGSWAGGGGNIDYSQSDNSSLNESTNKELQQQIKQLLSDKNVLNKISSSNLVKQMRLDAMRLILKRVQGFSNIKTYEELMSQYGNQLQKINNQIEQLKQNVKNEQDAQEQVEKAKQAILVSLKNQYKEFYIQQLSKLAQQDQSLKSFVDKTISQIKTFQ